MNLLSWISENYQWFFSGLGVTLLLGVVWVIKRPFVKDGTSQKQSSGKKSINIQASGDVDITNSSIKNDSKK